MYVSFPVIYYLFYITISFAGGDGALSLPITATPLCGLQIYEYFFIPRNIFSKICIFIFPHPAKPVSRPRWSAL